jgi:hypothetical protein
MGWVIYCMMGFGYGFAAHDREPSEWAWVGICSGVLFPFWLGVGLANWFYIVSKQKKGNKDV